MKMQTKLKTKTKRNKQMKRKLFFLKEKTNKEKYFCSSSVTKKVH